MITRSTKSRLLRWAVLCIVGAAVITTLITSRGAGPSPWPQDGTAPSPQLAQFFKKENAPEQVTSSPGFGYSLARSFGGLFICLGIFGAGVQLYRRYGVPTGTSRKARLTLVERLQISPKGALHLVALDGREFIVATGSEAPRVVLAPRDARAEFEESLVASAAAEVEKYAGFEAAHSVEVAHA